MTRLINESINDEAVYRTAPATPGLLNTVLTNRMNPIILLKNLIQRLELQNSSKVVISTSLFFLLE